MPDLADLLADLDAENDVLDGLVAPLDPDGWARPTPAPGWDVAAQIGHLAFFDEKAVLAATDPDRFVAEELPAVQADPEGYMAAAVGRAHAMAVADLLAWGRAGRRAFRASFAALDPKAKVPWYGPPMSVTSKVTSRLMETWAHGQDVVDALAPLGATREPTDRLRHIAHLAVRTRGFAYTANHRALPDGDVRVELAAPSGDTWTWGDPALPDRVSGPALDFCLVMTRRRHHLDTALVADGPLAVEWLEIGQTFAGPPGEGRRPGQFA
jgi:uncharacterized protein (TIGR03084 family)